jgi:hypothetical protein
MLNPSSFNGTPTAPNPLASLAMNRRKFSGGGEIAEKCTTSSRTDPLLLRPADIWKRPKYARNTLARLPLTKCSAYSKRIKSLAKSALIEIAMRLPWGGRRTVLDALITKEGTYNPDPQPSSHAVLNFKVPTH